MSSLKIFVRNAGSKLVNGVFEPTSNGFLRTEKGRTFFIKNNVDVPELGHKNCWTLQDETFDQPAVLYLNPDSGDMPPVDGWVSIGGLDPPPSGLTTKPCEIIQPKPVAEPVEVSEGGFEKVSILDALPGTKRSFWSDTFLFSHAGEFIEEKIDEKHGLAVILNDTIFHPQGGGQPTDEGVISGSKARFLVKFVSEDKDGIIYHHGTYETPEKFTTNEKISMQIDEEKRTLFAKLHTAGHLLDYALSEAGYPQLVPKKGFHFPDGAYVEYIGNIPTNERAQAQKKMQELIDGYISQNLSVHVRWVGQEEYKKITGCETNKESIRIVSISNFPPCGCGGTHLDTIGRLEKLKLKKFKKKGKNFRISYEIA